MRTSILTLVHTDESKDALKKYEELLTQTIRMKNI